MQVRARNLRSVLCQNTGISSLQEDVFSTEGPLVSCDQVDKALESLTPCRCRSPSHRRLSHQNQLPSPHPNPPNDPSHLVVEDTNPTVVGGEGGGGRVEGGGVEGEAEEEVGEARIV